MSAVDQAVRRNDLGQPSTATYRAASRFVAPAEAAVSLNAGQSAMS